MASIKDIAKSLNLGVSTVSMALNNSDKISQETKRLVNERAKKLGYVKNGLAVDLQKQKTNVIMLVVTDASRSYFSRFISKIQDEVARYKYDLIICTVENSTNTAKRYISEHRVDGAIVFTNKIEDDFLKMYARENFPIFVIGHYVEGDHIYCRGVYNPSLSGSTAVNYLIARGHKRIAFVKGSLSTLGSSTRFSGYKNTLKINNIDFDPSLVYEAKESNFMAGYRVTEKIIKDLDKIDAIYYANDDIAIGGLKCLINNNIRIPEDVSVIGNNNLPESALITPALTSVDLNMDTSAKRSVEVLIDAINKKEIDKEQLYHEALHGVERIIERGSVKERR